MTPSLPISLSPMDRLAPWVKGLFIANMIILPIAIWSGILQIDLLSHIASVTPDEAESNDTRQQWIGAVQTLIFVATTVFFLLWFRGAHKNLRVLGNSDLLYSPGWAVGGFFVPFLNLARPFQVMREVWHGSDPEGLVRDVEGHTPHRNNLGAPLLVGVWWSLFLASSILGNIAARLAFGDDQSIPTLQGLSLLMAVSDAVELASAAAAFSLVARITTAQHNRAARITAPPEAQALGALGA